MRLAFLAAAVLLWPFPSDAQVSTSFPRVEVSFLVGQSRPSAVATQDTGPRVPPTLVETGDTYELLTQDVTVRRWRTRRMSTIVDVGWSNEPSLNYVLPKPAPPATFPINAYDSQRTLFYENKLVSAQQAVDLVTSGWTVRSSLQNTNRASPVTANTVRPRTRRRCWAG